MVCAASTPVPKTRAEMKVANRADECITKLYQRQGDLRISAGGGEAHYQWPGSRNHAEIVDYP